MLQTIKNWIKSNLISLGVILLLLVYIVIHDFGSHSKYEVTKADTTFNPVSRYIAKDGVLINQFPVQIVTDKREFKKETKRFKKEGKGRIKIKQVAKFIEQEDTTLKNLPIKEVPNVQKDDLFAFGYSDNYMSIQALANITQRTGSITVKSIDTITYVDQVKKPFLGLGRDEHQISLSNKNKSNHILAGNAIELKEARPIIDVDLQVGYNPFTKKPYIGIGAGLHIFSIKKR